MHKRWPASFWSASSRKPRERPKWFGLMALLYASWHRNSIRKDGADGAGVVGPRVRIADLGDCDNRARPSPPVKPLFHSTSVLTYPMTSRSLEGAGRVISRKYDDRFLGG